ncbi:MAG: hypothetical protein M3N04_01595, partial [Actinomycetota bacterium]|nr:hypothetical protein [Actinomycetota bacterium]
MPKRNLVMFVVAAVVLLVVAGIVLAARDEDRAAAPPAGYAIFETQLKGRTVSFAYPRGWGAVERRTESGVQTFRFRGPPDADGERSAVRLAADLDAAIGFEAQYGLVTAHDRLTMANVEEISEEEVDVPGAERAKRLVLEYDLRTDGGGTQRSRASSIFAQSDDGLFVTLLVDT